MQLPVTIGEDLAANVLSHHGSALQVHEDAADGGLLGSLQLFFTHLACYCLLQHTSSSTVKHYLHNGTQAESSNTSDGGAGCSHKQEGPSNGRVMFGQATRTMGM